MKSGCLTLLFLCFNAFCLKKTLGQLSYFSKHENKVQGGNSKKKSFHAFLCMMCVCVEVKLHGTTTRDRYNELTLNSSLCWETKRGRENHCAQGNWEELGKKGVTWTGTQGTLEGMVATQPIQHTTSVTSGKWRVTFTSTHYYVHEKSSHGYYKGVHHTSCHTHWFLNCA